MKTLMKPIQIFSICFLLSACNIPTLFWEEEGRKIIDDIVLEEEKLDPSPPPKARPLNPARPLKKKSKKEKWEKQRNSPYP